MEVVELTKALISCQSVTPKNDGVLALLELEEANRKSVSVDIQMLTQSAP